MHRHRKWIPPTASREGAKYGVAAPSRTNSTHSLPTTPIRSKHHGWEPTAITLSGRDVYQHPLRGFAIERDHCYLTQLDPMEQAILDGILDAGFGPNLDDVAASHAADQWDSEAKELSRTAYTEVF